MTDPDPSGCRHCGVGHRMHFSRHADGVGRHQYAPPTEAQILQRMTARRTPAEALTALRRYADMVITNDMGDRVWLKQMPPEQLYPNGYITDCCFEAEPCDRHAATARRDQHPALWHGNWTVQPPE